MVGREFTNRIGGRGISGERKSLAAATAEITLAVLTTAAWLGHPIDASKAVEGIVVMPYPLQRPLTQR